MSVNCAAGRLRRSRKYLCGGCCCCCGRRRDEGGATQSDSSSVRLWRELVRFSAAILRVGRFGWRTKRRPLVALFPRGGQSKSVTTRRLNFSAVARFLRILCKCKFEEESRSAKANERSRRRRRKEEPLKGCANLPSFSLRRESLRCV